jgi:hypothetical protein
VSLSPVPSPRSDRSPGNDARTPAAAASPSAVASPGTAAPHGVAVPPGRAIPPGAPGTHRPGRRPGRALGLALVALAVTGLASCRPAPDASGPRPEAARGLAAVDFRNATYAPDSCSNFGEVPGGLVVKDGEAVPAPDGAVVEAEVWDVARGDVSGDDRDEVVVTLGCAGMSPWAQAWVFADDPAAAAGVARLGEVRIADEVLADARLARVRLISATVRDGAVVSTWEGYGMDVPVCCPSSTVTATFRVKAAGVALAAPVIISSPI